MDTRRRFLHQVGGLLAGGFALPALADSPSAPWFNFQVEIGHIFVELHLFCDAFLPILTRPISRDDRYDEPIEMMKARPPLCHWQATVDRLWRAVPRRRGRTLAALDPREFARLADRDDELAAGSSWTSFLANPPFRGLSPGPIGTIDWELPVWLNCLGDRRQRAARVLKFLDGTEATSADPWGEVRSREMEVIQWYLKRLGTVRSGAAHLFLSVIAELDPRFTFAVLDEARQEETASSSPRFTPEMGQSGWHKYSDTLCYAHALVLPLIAANHFPLMRRFLRLPGIVRGSAYWNGVATQGIFGVLYHKVDALRLLARD